MRGNTIGGVDDVRDGGGSGDFRGGCDECTSGVTGNAQTGGSWC